MPKMSVESQADVPVTVPWSREAVELVVAPHLERFGQVLLAAWEGFAAARDREVGRIGQVGPASRGMVVSDLTREPAHRVFDAAPGAKVVTRFDRVWVHLADGRVQVRFRKLTPALTIAPGQSDRARRLAYHLPDPTLGVECQEATVLTAGYVLDLAGLAVQQLALVCHVGFAQVHYWFPLPGVDAAQRPTQLPLAPLSAPIIRSARATAARQLVELREAE